MREKGGTIELPINSSGPAPIILPILSGGQAKKLKVVVLEQLNRQLVLKKILTIFLGGLKDTKWNPKEWILRGVGDFVVCTSGSPQINIR
ncbi:uncharacterized protein LOC112197422 isoform X2 [Rosa chinensis]|uniref:uncharacterized protein LOC112197422 isoform X2 n=1 Tax=Rosa chinensis TaxID=74649 RepID=UPI000D08B534|nr:uncharacterized protein LOC112197422 isoform X2 [Rosa chinensis]